MHQAEVSGITCSVQALYRQARRLDSHSSSIHGQAQQDCKHYPCPIESCSPENLQASCCHLSRGHVRADSTDCARRKGGRAQLLWCHLQPGAPLAGGLPGSALGGQHGARLAGRDPAAAHRWLQRWAAASSAARAPASAAPGGHQADVTSQQTRLCVQHRKGSRLEGCNGSSSVAHQRPMPAAVEAPDCCCPPGP